MSEMEFFGIALATFVGLLIAGLALWLVMGALGLHWAARFLRFKRPKFRIALVSQVMIVAVPSFSWGAAYFASHRFIQFEAVVLTLASLVSFALCVTVVGVMYGVTAGRAIAAYLLGTVLTVVVMIVIAVVITASVLGGGWLTGWRPSG